MRRSQSKALAVSAKLEIQTVQASKGAIQLGSRLPFLPETATQQRGGCRLRVPIERAVEREPPAILRGIFLQLQELIHLAGSLQGAWRLQ